MQHYAVVFFPEIDTTKIQELRKKYDPLWNVIPPHVTLVFPFSDIAEEEILNHLETISRSLKSFQIHLHDFTKSFDNYLFLLVQEGEDTIYTVHDTLYTGVLAQQLKSDIPFTPHMTLGVFNTKENQLDNKLYENALTEARKLNFDYYCSFNTISLIQGDGILPARIIKTFELT